jgi:hypothetical protein
VTPTEIVPGEPHSPVTASWEAGIVSAARPRSEVADAGEEPTTIGRAYVVAASPAAVAKYASGRATTAGDGDPAATVAMAEIVASFTRCMGLGSATDDEGEGPSEIG